MQPVGAQLPLMHVFEQHWLLKKHCAPSAVHVGPAPHVPLLQLPEQHWLPKKHCPALAVQPGGPQTPLVHIIPQQSPAAAHVSPSALHVGMPLLLLLLVAAPAPPLPVVVVVVLAPPLPLVVVVVLAPPAPPLPLVVVVELVVVLDPPPLEPLEDELENMTLASPPQPGATLARPRTRNEPAAK